MKIIAMIPARYAATRFPAKLMADLGGKPVIVRTYEETLKTGLFDSVFVVTDSEIIKNTIEKHGGKAILSKKEHECGSDRIAEAIENMDIDIVVNVQGDEPFVRKEPLEKLIEVFYQDKKNEIDLASLMQKMTDRNQIEDPNFVKVIVDAENHALYFSRSVIPYPREKQIDNSYYEHIGVYAFRKQALLDFSKLPMKILEATEKIECLRFLEYGKKIKMVETDYMGIEIDTPEDLEKAQKYFNN
jgi:3-deoxy-manno-octulosonate cytidylyltransferase (CMP-KDO synthetase)